MIMATDESIDLLGMWLALTDGVHADFEPRVAVSKLSYADSYRDHSQWYAWGAMDSGDSITMAYGRRVDAAWEFGYMMGILALLYVTERRYSMPSIQGAWRAFKASVDIDRYVG